MPEMAHRSEKELAQAVVKAAWRESAKNFARQVGEPREAGEYTLQLDSLEYIGHDLEMIAIAYYTHDGFGGGGGYISGQAAYRDGKYQLLSVWENFDGEPMYSTPIDDRSI